MHHCLDATLAADGDSAKVHKSCSKVSHVSKMVAPLNRVLYVATSTLRNIFDLFVADFPSQTTSSGGQRYELSGRRAASHSVA